VDKFNDATDALRYALTPLMRQGKMGALIFIEQERARKIAECLLPPDPPAGAAQGA
jgi:hypothetical protein